MNRKILNIKPYIEIEIDCTQNLLASLLEYYGYNIFLCGARWPWEFEYKKNDKHWKETVIKLTKNFSKKSLKEIYDINLIHNYFENSKDLLYELNRLIQNNKFVLVAVDQYYVPYHYNYIYKKKHGINTVLITGYDEKERTYVCTSAIPYYVGNIKAEVIKECIDNLTTYWMAYLDKPENGDLDKEKYVNNLFLKNMESLYTDFKNNNPSSFFYSKDLFNVLKNNTNEIMLKKLVEGDWCWKIDRKAELFKIYIHKSLGVYYQTDNLLSIDRKIDKLNKRWVILCRKLYMASQSENRKTKLYNCMKELNGIITTEQELMKDILAIEKREL